MTVEMLSREIEGGVPKRRPYTHSDEIWKEIDGGDLTNLGGRIFIATRRSVAETHYLPFVDRNQGPRVVLI